MNLLIIGAPGTGKGTMSKKIVETYHTVHVSTGDMLRAAIQEKSEVGLKAQEYMNRGALVPDEIIHDIIVERLSKDDIKDGFLFDGYPRTYNQALDLSEILKTLRMKIDCVLNLNVDENILVRRITGRRVCETCGAIFHIENQPSKVEGVCDYCGGRLFTRKDDTKESLEVRLKEYHKNTEPLIAYYQQLGLVKDINGEKDPAEVFEEIRTVLEGF